jgi:hypothetical protein
MNTRLRAIVLRQPAIRSGRKLPHAAARPDVIQRRRQRRRRRFARRNRICSDSHTQARQQMARASGASARSLATPRSFGSCLRSQTSISPRAGQPHLQRRVKGAP